MAIDESKSENNESLNPDVVRIELMGVEVDVLTEQELIGHITDALNQSIGGWVVTANLDILRRATRQADFRQLLLEADVVTADGMPLVWASCLQGTPLPARVTGSSLVWTLSEAAAIHRRSIFLIGGAPGAAQGARQALERRFGALRITGTCCPPLGFDQDEQQLNDIKTVVIKARPDIIYVALGSPKQERLIRYLRPALPSAWWLGVGASLSFLSGQVSRSPIWVQKVGLEWLYRLIQEPRRLAKRYLVTGLPFAIQVLFDSSRKRCWMFKMKQSS